MAAQALQGDIIIYRDIVRRSSSYAFYFHAPPISHVVLNEEGQRKQLNSQGEIKMFYGSTKPDEQDTIRVLRIKESLVDLL